MRAVNNITFLILSKITYP